MPPLPRFTNSSLASVASELRFAPKAAILRLIDGAESLALQVEPDGSYPVEFVVFRLTGYRPDAAPDVVLRGDELLRDLGVLVEHLSRRALLNDAEVGEGAIGIEDLARRWGVSRKTIERLRRRGLIGMRTRDSHGRERVVFRPSTVQAFERTHADAITSARAFSRMTPDQERSIFEEARALRSAHGWSMHRCARELAPLHSRGVETIRTLLRRLDEHAEVFTDAGPPDARQAGIFERALRRGIEPRELAERYGQTRRSVLRSASIRRIEILLGSLEMEGPGAEAVARLPRPPTEHQALQLALNVPGIRDAIRPQSPDRLQDLLDLMRERVVPIGIEERQQLNAIAMLVTQARSVLAMQSESATPSVSAIDLAETSLRRASLLSALAIRPHLRLLVDTLEQGLSRSLSELRPAPLTDLLRRALRAAGASLLAIDPRHGGRLAAPIGLATQRVVAAEKRTTPDAARARSRLPTDAPALDWTRSLHAWQELIEPPTPVIRSLLRTDDDDARILAARLGLERLAQTRTELSNQLRTTPARLAAAERRALRAAWLSAPLAGHAAPEAERSDRSNARPAGPL